MDLLGSEQSERHDLRSMRTINNMDNRIMNKMNSFGTSVVRLNTWLSSSCGPVTHGILTKSWFLYVLVVNPRAA